MDVPVAAIPTGSRVGASASSDVIACVGTEADAVPVCLKLTVLAALISSDRAFDVTVITVGLTHIMDFKVYIEFPIFMGSIFIFEACKFVFNGLLISVLYCSSQMLHSKHFEQCVLVFKSKFQVRPLQCLFQRGFNYHFFGEHFKRFRCNCQSLHCGVPSLLFITCVPVGCDLLSFRGGVMHIVYICLACFQCHTPTSITVL